MKAEFSQHAINQFAQRFLGLQHRIHRDEYYQDLLQNYLEEAVEIKPPSYVSVEKALKYDGSDGGSERFMLNRRERLLFVIVGGQVLTVYYPYDDSRRFERRYYRQLYKRDSRKDKQ